MTARSPSSFAISLTLHALVAAVIFLTTVYVSRQDQVQPVIFELVAGPPTAPDALEAPALGNTTEKVKLDVPKVDLPPEPPSTPAVQEVAPPPQPPEAVEVPPAKPPPPKPAPAKPAPTKPKADASMTKELKKNEKMSYQDYLKKHPIPKRSAPTTTPRPAGRVPRIDTTGIANGVKGGSTANTRGGGGGKALTREEQSLMDTYFSLLLQELKRAHEPPPGVSDQLETRVTFDITASGAILNPRITRSSGDPAFDESVLEAFRRVRSIGPTPNRKADTWTVNFKMQDD
jgi:colicin import membrane protein